MQRMPLKFAEAQSLETAANRSMVLKPMRQDISRMRAHRFHAARELSSNSTRADGLAAKLINQPSYRFFIIETSAVTFVRY